MPATYGRQLGSNANSSTGTSLVITTSAVANVGERIVVCICNSGNQTITVTDSAGNTYVQDESFDSAALNRIAAFSAPADTELPSGGTITVTWDADTSWRGAIAVALVGVGAEESSSARRLDTASGSTVASTLTAASGVVIGFTANRNPSDLTFTAGTNFTAVTDIAPLNLNFGVEYRVVSAAGDYNMEATWSAQNNTVTWGHVIYPESAGGNTYEKTGLVIAGP